VVHPCGQPTAGIPALDEFDEFWMNVNGELEAHEEVRLGR
jgi:hypothetical protein